MHILTKIFVVLVSLLSIGIVPLVVVQSVNEATFKEKYLVERDSASAVRAALSSSQALAAQVETGLQTQLKEAEVRLARAAADVEENKGRVRVLDAEKSALGLSKSALESNIQVLTETDRARTDLVGTLNTEVSRLRDRLVDAEKSRVDMEARAAELSARFEVADEARKQLQEEVTRLTSKSSVSAGPTVATGGLSVSRQIADRDLRAHITHVRRDGDRYLAQVDHGSRDGIRPGWVFTIAQADGKSYVGDLVIDRVDVDRAVGHVEWLGASDGSQPEVEQGQIATARKGY